MAWDSAEELDWDALYSDQLPRIYNYFRFRVGAYADAEDLTARTFEKAWQASRHKAMDTGAPIKTQSCDFTMPGRPWHPPDRLMPGPDFHPRAP
jgi:hypothetical protein